MGAEEKRRRLIEVDRVTGFAIILVVLGHIVARKQPLDNEWYFWLKFAIYQFHMPLFMFMSGLIFRYTLGSLSSLSEYREWAFKKFARLAPGFFLVGTAITLGKVLAGNFLHIDNAQTDPLLSFLLLFVQPTDSAASSLWYIYVLLEFYLLFPILILVFQGRDSLILVLVLAMHIAHLTVPLPRTMAVHTIFEFAMYFWLGAMSCRHYDRVIDVTRRHRGIFTLVFLISFASIQFLPWTHSPTLIGLASIPAMLYLIGANTGRTGRFFAWLSGYTFVIYLLNTVVIGLTKGLMLKLLPWDGVNFYLFFLILTTVGMIVPILAQRLLFSRNRTLSRIMN